MIKITTELIIVRESQYMYNRARGFQPVEGNLFHWHGNVFVKKVPGFKIGVDIYIPENYPSSPPICKVSTPVDHPNIDPNTNHIRLPILEQGWNPEIHLYQVVNHIKGIFNRVDLDPPRPS